MMLQKRDQCNKLFYTNHLASKNVQNGIKEFNKNYNETGNLKSLIKLRNKINDELKHD